MPSAPKYPSERQSAQRPAGRREYESFDSYQSGTFVVPAGTAFVEAVTFNGRPDSIRLFTRAGAHFVRLRNRGEAPGEAILISAAEVYELKCGAEILEIFDTSGVGGNGFDWFARYSSRAIDVRTNRPGPSRERPTLPDETRATQVLTSE